MASSQADTTSVDESRNSGAETVDPIVCACTNLTLSQLTRFIAEAKNNSFESLLAATGSGQTCTACLLDLEFHYSAIPVSTPSAALPVAGEVTRGTDRPSPKQRLWSLLDRLSPPVSWRGKQCLPVVSGEGIETHVCVANHPLLFSGAVAPPLLVRVEYWDEEGGLVLDRKSRVAPGQEFRLRLKPGHTSADKPLSVDSARITSRALTSGPRGTTRPQIELLSPAGACAVHTQAATGPGIIWFTTQWRPADERLFLSIINPSHEPLTATVSYPHAGSAEKGAIQCSISIPAMGARLHEVRFNGKLEAIADPTFNIRIACDRMNKVHLLCATPSLDRFSIDHQ